jgi:hypothetical protein
MSWNSNVQRNQGTIDTIESMALTRYDNDIISCIVVYRFWVSGSGPGSYDTCSLYVGAHSTAD